MQETTASVFKVAIVSAAVLGGSFLLANRPRSPTPPSTNRDSLSISRRQSERLTLDYLCQQDVAVAKTFDDTLRAYDGYGREMANHPGRCTKDASGIHWRPR